MAQILEALGEMGLPNGLVARGGPNGLLLALLHMLPKLQRLIIGARAELGLLAKSCMGAFAGGVPAGLLSISELSISYDPTANQPEGGFETQEVIPFLILPSLRILTVEGFAGEDDDEIDEEGDLPRLKVHVAVSPKGDSGPLPSSLIKTPTGYAMLEKSSSIKELRLIGSVVPCSLIDKILAVPTELETFEYDVGAGTVGYTPFRPEELVPGLLSQAQSLKELSISTGMGVLDMDEDDPFIGSLSDMMVLQTLQITDHILLPSVNGGDETNDHDDSDGSEREEEDQDQHPPSLSTRNPMDSLLPPNLVSLTIHIGDRPLDEFLALTGLPGSLSWTQQRIPKLASVSVYGDNRPPEERLAQILKGVPQLHPPIRFSCFGIVNEAEQQQK
ncbi:hypothetical protein DL93DRAFT_2171100 [Clavulina sp. PMI_390]|nr:hypothetical protein DL93DRAFT_2171100 [Clavulina sp. PMI_390]